MRPLALRLGVSLLIAVVYNYTTRPVYQAIGARDRTIKYYEGLFHEVFNEPERAQVVDDLVRWLER